MLLACKETLSFSLKSKARFVGAIKYMPPAHCGGKLRYVLPEISFAMQTVFMILKNKTDFNDSHNKSQLPKLTFWINHNQGREKKLKVPTIKPLYEQKLYYWRNCNTNCSLSPSPPAIQPPLTNSPPRHCHIEPWSSRRPDHHALYFQRKKIKSSCPCIQTQHTYKALDLCIGVNINPIISKFCSFTAYRHPVNAPGLHLLLTPRQFLPLHYFSAVIQPQYWSPVGGSGCLNPGTGQRNQSRCLTHKHCFALTARGGTASHLATIQPPRNVPHVYLWPWLFKTSSQK